jgi:hypothetical protein
MKAPIHPTSSLVARWERFWFAQIPSDIFALLRIVFGAVGLIGVLAFVPVSIFWPLDGLVPVSGTGNALRHAALSVGIGTIGGWTLFLFLVASFTCMTVGFLSGWAVACCFGATVLQSFWNPWPMSGAHDVLTVMLFCLLWADCSGRPSVDAWRARTSKQPPRLQSITPIRLMQIQVALIYMNSALWKLGGPTWRDGSTIHYVLNLNTYQRFPGVVPVFFEPFMTVSTYLTVFWEATFGLMLLNRWTRRAALLFGIALHIGLWVTMELGTFSWVILASYIAFMDPQLVSRWMQRLASPASPMRTADGKPHLRQAI